MKTLIALLSVFLFTSTAFAADNPMPRSDYPPHSSVTYYADLSNGDYDCGIAIDCTTGEPMLHMTLSDNLHRVKGWAVISNSRHQTIQFLDMFNQTEDGSENGVPYNESFYKDCKNALHTWQGHQMKADLLPKGVKGYAFFVPAHDGAPNVMFLVAMWGTTSEAEIAGIFPKGYKGMVMHDLKAQMANMVAQ
jgi:hypothetical protein